MKKYTFEIVIEEGCDEFWESITDTGVEEIKASIEECLDTQCWIMSGNATVTLKKFEDV